MAEQPRSGRRHRHEGNEGRREGKGEWRNARSLAVNEGGAIKSRACVEGGCTVQTAEGREGAGSCCCDCLRKGEWERERAQINLLSGGREPCLADRGRTGWPPGGPGRNDLTVGGPLAVTLGRRPKVTRPHKGEVDSFYHCCFFPYCFFLKLLLF